MEPEQTEEPAAENTADNTYDQIDDEAETASAHQFSRNEAREDTDNYKPDEAHDKLFLRIILFSYKQKCLREGFSRFL